ncbi:hypothetical protein ACN47E_001063 [Coniothyrium glycines]
MSRQPSKGTNTAELSDTIRSSKRLPNPPQIGIDCDSMDHFAPRARSLHTLLQGLCNDRALSQSPSSFEFKLIPSGSELKIAELNACLSLVESTSVQDYRNSRIGWHPRKKRLEMSDEEMIYLLVRHAGANFEEAQSTQKIEQDEVFTTKHQSDSHSPEQYSGNGMTRGKQDQTAQSNTDDTVLDDGDAQDNHDNKCDVARNKPTAGDNILGFLSFMFTNDDPPHENREVVYIYEIHLQKCLRGQGLGSRLIKFAEGAARECGISKVMLTVFTANIGARALYERLGYSKDKCSPRDRIVRNKTIEAEYAIMSKLLA